ncbi:hypothetical protein GCM10022236_39210 [Microlunatus ginsengisoli]|uniref:ANTAR domain-containing protein n=1 Tax=Microlunatus ginsengisoli TaxID=363863 RepID=A0ABP7AID4_9ACTN
MLPDGLSNLGTTGIDRTGGPRRSLTSVGPPTGWLRRISYLLARELCVPPSDALDDAFREAWAAATAAGHPLTDSIMVHLVRQRVRVGRALSPTTAEPPLARGG